MASAPPTGPAEPEKPKSFIEKVGPALAVGLTAIAAVFGSMSAAQLQQAMYWKSQAAQDQSKSTNQWTLAGFKRDRALTMDAAAKQLRAMSEYAPATFPADALPPIRVKKDDPHPEETRKQLAEAQKEAVAWLEKRDVPPVSVPEIKDANIQAIRKAIENRESVAEELKIAAKVDTDAITHAIDEAEKNAEQIDKQWDATVKAAAEVASYADEKKPAPAKERTARQAAGYELEERRYRAESKLNQGIGFLYDIRVKVSMATSDQHRRKSVLLGYAMLVAQIGAVAASLALARKRQISLWVVATMIGLGALAFGGYALLPASIFGF